MNSDNSNINLMSEEEMYDPSISASKLLNGDRIYHMIYMTLHFTYYPDIRY